MLSQKPHLISFGLLNLTNTECTLHEENSKKTIQMHILHTIQQTISDYTGGYEDTLCYPNSPGTAVSMADTHTDEPNYLHIFHHNCTT